MRSARYRVQSLTNVHRWLRIAVTVAVVALTVPLSFRTVGQDAPQPATPTPATSTPTSTSVAAEAPAATAPAATAPAAETPPPVTPAPVEQLTLDAVQARLKQLDEAKELDDAAKSKIREFYQQAIRELESARTWSVKAAEFDKMAKGVAEQLAQTEERLAALPKKARVEFPDDLTLTQLEHKLSEKETELTASKEQLSTLEAEPRRRQTRRGQIPGLIATAKERLSELDKQLAASAPSDESPAITAARRTLQLSRKQATTAEISGYEKELAAYGATGELLPKRRDRAAGEVSLKEDEVKQWRARVDQIRQQEAKQQAKTARTEANFVHPVLQPLAETNRELADRSELMAKGLKAVASDLESAKKTLEAIELDFKRTEDKIEAVGLTDAIGLSLRKQLAKLPNLRRIRRDVRSRKEEIRSVQLELIEFDEHRSELTPADFDRTTQKLIDEIDWQTDFSEAEIESAVRELLEKRRDLLDVLIRDGNTYFDRLIELDTERQRLIAEIERFDEFIDERVLWVPSAEPLRWQDVQTASIGIGWITNTSQWLDMAYSLIGRACGQPLYPFAFFAVFIPLIFIQRPMRRVIEQIGEQARHGGFDRFGPTLKVLAVTLLIAGTWPAVLCYSAWRIVAPLDASDFAKAMANGLLTVSAIWFPLEILRQFCRPLGLAQAHFGWSKQATAPVRWHVRWLMPCLPLAFIVGAISQTSDRHLEPLGRLCFLAGLLLIAVFMHNVLHAKRGVAPMLMAHRRNTWLVRLRLLWHVLGVMGPLSLAVLDLSGYSYTALRLSIRLHITVWLILSLLVCGELFLRWSLVVRRRLAIAQAKERQAQAKAETAPGQEVAASNPTPQPTTDVDYNLGTINDQTRKLLHLSLGCAAFIGFWFVWVDVLPALRMLDRIPLWDITVQVREEGTTPEGVAFTHWVEKPDFVSLADLVATAGFLGVVLLATRNIPGLLELLLLARLPLDSGTRYAVSTITCYSIALVGMIVACGMIGITWSSVQWLAAAVTLGLGFGLQEIFANFVSGLIILFEQPMRVGDIVTVDDVSGVVSQIRIRATTITNWDRQEFIVPNKEFITGRMFNWTLSNRVNRVVVNVGVAYGSDTRRAHEILLNIAQEHPIILDDPAPVATFDGFGDSALNFVLRCYLPDLDNRLAIINELHMTIDERFRAAGIEIAFPQRDLHIRTISPAIRLFDHESPPVVHPQEESTTTITAKSA